MELIGLGGALIVLLAIAAIRIPTQSMWLDEAYTRAAVNDFWFDLRTFRGTMFLYMVLMQAWATISSATWWLRMPSLLASVGTLVVLRPIARRIGGARLVLVALPFTALLTGFQWIATDARSYALATFWTTLAWYCMIRGRDDPRPGTLHQWWYLLAVLGVLGPLTHGLFVVQLVPIAVVSAIGAPRAMAIKRLLPTVVSSTVTMVVLLAVGAGNKNGTYIAGGPAEWIGSSFDVFLSANTVLKVVLAELLLLAMVLAFRSFRSASARRAWPSLVPAAWFLLPCVALGLVGSLTPTYNPRYLSPVLPGLGLLFGVAATQVDRWLSTTRSSLHVAKVGLGSLGFAVLLGAAALVAPYPMSQDWRGAVRTVSDAARPGDGIVFADSRGQFPETTRPAFEATWQEQRRPTTPRAISPYRPLGTARSHDPVLPVDLVEQRVQPFRRVWIVQGRGVGAPDHIAEITGDPRFAGFERAGKWSFSGDIELELWQRRAEAR